MAIRKVSRLQHRRGLKSDLPTKLNEGELGWCLDTRELFIGNSDAEPSNSQILTQWTPNDKVITHSYVGNTGVPAATITRTLGSKLDDFVNVRDYGAVGNGIVDDTVSIQLAITDLYNKSVANGFNPLSAFSTIWIPAGTYRITESLKLYPYVKLQGEGPYRTVILMDSETALCVAETVDSNGNTELNIGLNEAIIPTKIDLCDMALVQPRINADGIRISRANNINISNLRIEGPRQYESEVLTTGIAVNIRSYGTTPSLIPNNITLDKTEICGFDDAIYSDDPIKNLHLYSCHIHDCIKGITLGNLSTLGGPAMTRVSNCIFNKIENHAISNKGDNLGVVSIGNVFDTVGIFNDIPAIIWGTVSSGCSSIGDQFVNVRSSFISNQNPAYNSIIGPQKVSITVDTPDLIGPILLADNHPITPLNTSINYDTAIYNTITINYSLSRGTNKQVGKLTILTNGSSAILQDEFNTLGSDLGVTFGYRIVDSILTVTYKTTATGFDVNMLYTESKWFT